MWFSICVWLLNVHNALFDFTNLYYLLKTVKIRISWLLMKPADKDLHCFSSTQCIHISFETTLLDWLEKSKVHIYTRLRSTVGNMSGKRCESDCRSRGCEFDTGPVPYFRGDWLWNKFSCHSPPFRWFIQEGLLSVTSKSMCTKYWLTACSSLPRKKMW